MWDRNKPSLRLKIIKSLECSQLFIVSVKIKLEIVLFFYYFGAAVCIQQCFENIIEGVL